MTLHVIKLIIICEIPEIQLLSVAKDAYLNNSYKQRITNRNIFLTVL